MDYDIVEKIFRQGRWWVRTNPSMNGNPVIKYAHFVWLAGNPGFEGIPKNYVVHHLDGDQLNDDISNLVIMQKNHHMAYHFKNSPVQTSVVFDSYAKGYTDVYYPRTEPKYYKRHCNKPRYTIYFMENNFETGKSEKRTLSSWHGQPIDSIEMINNIKSLIWKPKEEKQITP